MCRKNIARVEDVPKDWEYITTDHVNNAYGPPDIVHRYRCHEGQGHNVYDGSFFPEATDIPLTRFSPRAPVSPRQ